MFIPKSVAAGKVSLCVIAVVEAVFLVFATGVVATKILGASPADSSLIIEGAIITAFGSAFASIVHIIFD